MKTKKTPVIFLICSIMIMTFMLAGCSGSSQSNDKYVGTWKADSCEYQGVKMSVDDLLGEFTLELAKDGTCDVTVNGTVSSCNWEATEDGFKILDQEEELEMKNVDGKMTLDYDGVDLFFVKME